MSQGVQVACESRPKDTPPLEVYRIHKVCNDVTVPALAPVRFEMGTPPERRFQSGKPTPGGASTAR